MATTVTIPTLTWVMPLMALVLWGWHWGWQRWVMPRARRRIESRLLRRFLREQEAEHGPVDPALVEQARAAIQARFKRSEP